MKPRNLQTLLVVVVHTKALGGLFPAGSNWHNARHRALAKLVEEGLVEKVSGDARGHGQYFVATPAGFAEIEKITAGT